MTNEKKCANPACSCHPADGSKFCGAYCEGTKGATGISCQCGHASCGGAALKV
jgi:hypothetical protein